jgi:hypothetical protein
MATTGGEQRTVSDTTSDIKCFFAKKVFLAVFLCVHDYEGVQHTHTHTHTHTQTTQGSIKSATLLRTPEQLKAAYTSSLRPHTLVA